MRIGSLAIMERETEHDRLVREYGELMLLQSAGAKERGHSGYPTSGGERIWDETTDHNEKWRIPDRWTTVREMRNDGDVSAAMDAVILPLLAADFRVVPGSESAEDAEIAAFIENDLLNMTSVSLTEHRYDCLDDMLSYGVAVYQKVIDYDRGTDKIHLRKLASRPPWSIRPNGWVVDPHGGPKQLTQIGTFDDKQSRGQDVEFDIDELVLFIHRRKGGDILGQPLIRRCYGSWLAKERLVRIGIVAADIGGSGIKVMRSPADDAATSNRIDQLLMSLRTHIKGYIRLTAQQKMEDFEIKGVDGELVDPVPQMEFHRRGIYLTTLTQFLPLGTDGVGARALSEDHSSFFLMLLKAIAKMEAEPYNRYVIPPLVEVNWPGIPESRLPKVEIGPINQRDVDLWFKAVVAAVNPKTGAGIDLDRDMLREMAHELLGLPEPPEPREPESVEQDGTDADDSADDPLPETVAGARQRMDSEVALEALGIEVNFVAMSESLDAAEAGMLKVARKIQARQIRNLITRGREVVARGDAALVADTEVRFVDDMAGALEAELVELYELGLQEAGSEMQQQGARPEAPEDSGDALDVLAAMGLVMAQELADRLHRTWSDEVLRQIRLGGGFDKTALGGLLDGLADSTILDAARQRSAPALNLGRSLVLKANEKILKKLINAEVMDGQTCDRCREVDGKEVPPGDASRFAPYAECRGRSRCRGVVVPVVDR